MQLQLLTYRKSCVGFEFQPLDLTLDDVDSMNQGHDSLKVLLES